MGYYGRQWKYSGISLIWWDAGTPPTCANGTGAMGNSIGSEMRSTLDEEDGAADKVGGADGSVSRPHRRHNYDAY
jgi:hypothetical protein